MTTEFLIGNCKNMRIAYFNISQSVKASFGNNGLSKLKEVEGTHDIIFYPAYTLVSEDAYKLLSIKISKNQDTEKASVIITYDDSNVSTISAEDIKTLEENYHKLSVTIPACMGIR